MAGAVKHMERSHRKYGKTRSEFGRFEKKATYIKGLKKKRESLLDKFKNFFRKGDR